MTYLDRISVDPDICHGMPCIADLNSCLSTLDNLSES